MRKAIVSVIVMGGLLAACQSSSNPGEFGANKTTGGTLLGAVGGAVAGSQFGGGRGRLVAVAAGTLLGAFVGREVGASLDRADIAYAQQAENRVHTAPLGEPIRWNNPESGNSGSYMATREGVGSRGEQCREYQSTVMIGGKAEQAYGTACLQPDGSWKVVN